MARGSARLSLRIYGDGNECSSVMTLMKMVIRSAVGPAGTIITKVKLIDEHSQRCWTRQARNRSPYRPDSKIENNDCSGATRLVVTAA